MNDRIKTLIYRVAASQPLFATFVLVTMASLSLPLDAEDNLEIRMLDVGQADAIFITCPDGDHHLLIDSADRRYPDSSATFRSEMESLYSGKPFSIDLVVASHPHTDHIGSMEWVLTTFAVNTYIDNGQNYDSAIFGRLLALRRKLVKAGKLLYINGKESSLETIDFCGKLQVRIFEPWAMRDISDPNDRSVGVWIKYKSTTMLFVGDMMEEAEKTLLDELSDDDRTLLDADLLKVGHHGSDTSSTAAFLQAVTPTCQ